MEQASSNQPIAVGILSDTLLQRQNLESFFIHHGFHVTLSLDPDQFHISLLDSGAIKLWFIDLHDDHHGELIEQLLDCEESSQTVLLFSEGVSPTRHDAHYERWQQSLNAKLASLIGKGFVTQSEQQQTLDALKGLRDNITLPLPMDYRFSNNSDFFVWVLGASMGGPTAVKQFLDALPAGLPVAFLYAQHVDETFEAALANLVGRHCAYIMKMAKAGDCLNKGEVLIVPTGQELSFDKNGLMVLSNQPWPGPFSPSIDQVIANTVSAFGKEKTGVIVFSGDGDDGSLMCPVVARQGVPVWGQSNADNHEMVSAVEKSGALQLQASCHELATLFVENVIDKDHRISK